MDFAAISYTIQQIMLFFTAKIRPEAVKPAPGYL